MDYIPYATQWIDDDDIKAVAEALRKEYLTQGPSVAELEKAVAAYCGAKYAVAVNSGTSALHAACFAAGIGQQDEVITSPITFVASSNCVLYCGGTPVFADIEDETVNIDPFEAEKKITPGTKAIIPVHFAGQPVDLETISAAAKKNGLIVIEDACHALGASYKGSRTGSCKYSDMTVLSFHAVKHVTTGEGGMVLTNDKKLYEKLIMFRSHGITKDGSLMENKSEGPWFYEMQHLGYNYRITDFQCALGLSQIKKLDGFVKRRRQIAAMYDEAFKGLGPIRTIMQKEGAASAYHLYIIRVKDGRKRIFDELREQGIGVNVHYIPVHLQPYYQKLGYKKGSCPKAEKYYSETITLPLYPKMTDEQVRSVISAVRSAIGG